MNHRETQTDVGALREPSRKSAYLHLEQIRKPSWASMDIKQTQTTTAFTSMLAGAANAGQILDKEFLDRTADHPIKCSSMSPKYKSIVNCTNLENNRREQ
jgi:hypothetical protein